MSGMNAIWFSDLVTPSPNQVIHMMVTRIHRKFYSRIFSQ